MLSPKLRLLTLAILTVADITPNTLARIRQDLETANSNALSVPVNIKALLASPIQYTELCLGCLQPTGYGKSYELQVGCSSCGTFAAQYKMYQLEFLLQAESEGCSRKALMQWCYLCLQDNRGKRGSMT